MTAHLSMLRQILQELAPPADTAPPAPDTPEA